MKKPISGKPEIGAQLTSFNFPNNLIRQNASTGLTLRCRPLLIGSTVKS
jgi:hypothetical protein